MGGVKPCEMWMLGYVARWYETDKTIDGNEIREWLYHETDHEVDTIDDFAYGTAERYIEEKVKKEKK